MNRYPALIALALAVLLPGCHDGAAPAPSQEQVLRSAIVGTWQVRSITGPSGAIQDCPTSITVDNLTFSCNAQTKVTYHADGTFLTVAGTPGIYSIAANKLTVTAPTQSTGTLSIAGNIMSQYFVAPNQETATVTFERVP